MLATCEPAPLNHPDTVISLLVPNWSMTRFLPERENQRFSSLRPAPRSISPWAVVAPVAALLMVSYAPKPSPK
jgi:hypothetical protein